MTYRYRLLPDGTGYVDAEGVHRGVPPTQEDFDRVALMTMHRTLFTFIEQARKGSEGANDGDANSNSQ